MVIITGAGTGIGRAAARAFAAEGARVLAVGRRSEPLAETAAGAEGDGGRAHARRRPLLHRLPGRRHDHRPSVRGGPADRP
ncbi:SDR family NAD(P)-dependent oxidoreductase [Streptomyces platensis]